MAFWLAVSSDVTILGSCIAADHCSVLEAEEREKL